VWGSVVFSCFYSRLLLSCRYCCCWWWRWWWCCLALKFLYQPPVQCIPGLFPGGKAAGELRCPPTPTRAEVIETVELQIYRLPPPGLLWPVLGQTLPLPLPLPLQNTKLFLALLLQLLYCNLFFQSFIIYFLQ
jgi:hypothetical protein